MACIAASGLHTSWGQSDDATSGVLSIQVLWEDTSAAVAGATVSASNFNVGSGQPETIEQQTDARGMATLQIPPLWDFPHLTVFHADAANFSRALGPRPPTQLTVQLKRIGRVSGRVWLGSRDVPATNALVMSIPYGQWTEAAKDGSFEVRLRQLGRVGLLATQGEWVSPTRLEDILRLDLGSGPPPAPVDLTLRRGAAVVGTIKDGDTGAPLPGASITAWFGLKDSHNVPLPEQWPVRATTNNAGVYRLPGLPRGVFHLVVTTQGHDPEEADVSLTEAPETRRDFALGRQASVFGTVHYEGTGQPVAGAEILIEAPRRGAKWTTRSDANGKYDVSLGAESGAVRVTAVKGEWRTHSDPSDAEMIPLAPSQRYGPLDLVLESGMALVGTVRDQATGSLIASAAVYAPFRPRHEFPRKELKPQAMTDGDGVYRVEGLGTG
ncbi:MAG: carboxypeptidase-like regulatory domain-containing protein, partial [Candidatus Sumerlaeota bacterium]|nr:carboxypeptidase-like regulatory domain-containing protein [Candidatus Sumerlaeota bacterium]